MLHYMNDVGSDISPHLSTKGRFRLWTWSCKFGLLRNHSSFVTQAVMQGYFTQTKSIVSVIQKHVTTLLIKLCDRARNKASGCGVVGSTLPWGGRCRKFKSCLLFGGRTRRIYAMLHSDQNSVEIARFLHYFFVFMTLFYTVSRS